MAHEQNKLILVFFLQFWFYLESQPIILNCLIYSHGFAVVVLRINL